MGIGLDDRDAVRPEHGGIADAGEFEELRRADRAGRQDHLAARPRRPPRAAAQIFDADGAAALEQDAGGVRAGLDGQIGAFHRRAQEGAGGRHAAAVLRGDLVDADAFLRRAVEVGIEGQAGRPSRLQVEPGEGVHMGGHVADMDRAAPAAPVVGAGLVVLDRLEEGQQIVIAPAGIAGRRPGIVVGALAADPHHRVDRGGAAEQLAARPVVGIAGQPRVRLGAKVPVHLRVEEGLAVAERHLHEEAPVGAAGLEQQHGETAARGQPLGQHAAGGARTHHDEIEVPHRLPDPASR